MLKTAFILSVFISILRLNFFIKTWIFTEISRLQLFYQPDVHSATLNKLIFFILPVFIYIRRF